MLERVALLSNDLDLGAIAEAIVYYGNVELVCFDGQMVKMVERIGIADTIRLAESELINFTYKISTLAISTDTNALYQHSIFDVTPQGTPEGKPINNAEDELVDVFQRKFGAGVIAKRDVRRLAAAMSDYQAVGRASGDNTASNMQDAEFLSEAIRSVIKTRIPNYSNPERISASAIVSGQDFTINSNVDFELASKLFSTSHHSPGSTITSAYLALPILGMNEIMLYAGDRRCDLWADETASSLLQLRVQSLARRLQRSRRNIEHFHEEKFFSRSFANAIETGERTFSEVLDFAEAEETRKFKRWISEAPEGSDLLAEYEKSKVAPSKLAASLPVQATKRLLFTAAGFGLDKLIGGSGVVGGMSAALASEVVLNSADKLLSSHMKLGWKPNQWVANAAGPFLRRS